MKKILLLLCVTFYAHCLDAQALSFETMGDRMKAFCYGCMQLNRYITSNDREYLTTALTILNPKQLEIADFDPEPVDIADETSLDSHMRYDYSYALALLNNLVWEDNGLSRGISTCTVKLLALKPGGIVKYRTSGIDDLYLYTIAEPHARVMLSVEEVATGIVHEGASLEEGTISFVSWNQPYECELVITIHNLSESVVSLALASQGD